MMIKPIIFLLIIFIALIFITTVEAKYYNGILRENEEIASLLKNNNIKLIATGYGEQVIFITKKKNNLDIEDIAHNEL